MKIRSDFVTNSSSTSYIYKGFYSQDLLSYVIELVRAGYIKKLTMGVYNYLPLMWRVLKKVQTTLLKRTCRLGVI